MADAGLVQKTGMEEVVEGARVRWGALSSGHKRTIWMGAAALAVGAGALAWYGSRTDYRVLFSGLDGKDVAQVSQELGAASVPFQTTADGTGVQVPAELLDKARMEVAAKGMPQTGRMGFELFDKPNWVGSEFDERVNYQRALEGELEHTIGTLGVVRSARVHVVLPQQSLFTSEEKAAKASVVLKLKRASLGPEQAESIRNLVAGAVENLNPDQVTLVDADGRMNFGLKGGVSAVAEAAMESRLVAMLEPLAGAGNVRATVNVAYDEGKEERTDEVYDPAAVAGTPPLLRGAASPPNGGVTRHLTHTEVGPGRVKRVTAAVVVNDRMVTEGSGRLETTVWKPRTAEEMQRLESLAQAAVGFDAARGDQVVMENVGFSSNVPEAKAAGLESVLEQAKGFTDTQPGLLKTGLMGLVGLALVWFVLKPVAGQMVSAMRQPVRLSAGVAEQRLAEDERWKASPVAKLQEPGVLQVTEQMEREPEESTRLSQVADARERATGDLAMLGKMEPRQLSKFLENEHPQTVALVLAHLDTKVGAAVLMHMGAEMRVEALRRLAEMRQFSPKMAQKVALVLHRRMGAAGTAEQKSYPGYKAVAELLNHLDGSASGGILEEIGQKEPKVAADIRTLMFAFGDGAAGEKSVPEVLVAAADKKKPGTVLNV